MILVDTSVWIDHFRRSNGAVREALEEEQVVCHPFVIGELTCGNLHPRREILELLARLPLVSVADDVELFRFLEVHRLMGRGLGWVDIHLLGAALIARTAVWTNDRALRDAARLLELSTGT